MGFQKVPDLRHAVSSACFGLEVHFWENQSCCFSRSPARAFAHCRTRPGRGTGAGAGEGGRIRRFIQEQRYGNGSRVACQVSADLPRASCGRRRFSDNLHEWPQEDMLLKAF